MPLFWRQKAILGKLETGYGVDAVPTGAADAVQVVNLSLDAPMDNEMVERNIEQAYFGHQELMPVSTKCTFGFDLEMVGSGVVDTPPQYGRFLRACGFNQTVTALTNVIYAPVTPAVDSLTFYINIGGVQHKFLGARGSVGGIVKSRGVPYLRLKFTTLYGGIADVAVPALTLTAWKTPVAVNNANTSAFSILGYAGKLYSLDFDVACELAYRNIVGTEEVLIGDRKPVGNIEIEAPTIATKDFFTAAKTPTLGPLTITHGTVAGYKTKIDAPLVQVLNPKVQGSEGNVVTLNMGLRFKPSAGNDEIVITHF